MPNGSTSNGGSKRSSASKSRSSSSSKSSKRAQRSSSDDKKGDRKRNDAFEVNLSVLNLTTLKRYKKHYHLKDDAPTKRELVKVVTEHFRAQVMSVSEQETILLFSHMIKNNMSKLDKK